jgi:hypothetical protein
MLGRRRAILAGRTASGTRQNHPTRRPACPQDQFLTELFVDWVFIFGGSAGRWMFLKLCWPRPGPKLRGSTLEQLEQ